MARLQLVFALTLSVACRVGTKASEGALGTDTGALSNVDADGDGYTADEDCDDSDASVHAGATEICDGIDNDCDGEVDEDVTGTWYRDADGDGYGDVEAPVEACTQPSGTVTAATDCDDTDASVNPVAIERCNGVDDDCDGDIDEELTSTWYADADGDGFGDADAPLEDCDPPDGYVEDTSDCDDGDIAVNPDADEVCDGIDNDCDGDIDTDATDLQTWYLDADGDGFGDADRATQACEAPSGHVADNTDCDDGNVDVNPDASEVCNRIDDDCDGLTDDDDPSVDPATQSTWYADADSDGFGDPGAATTACDQPSGTVTDRTDCDDADPSINPDAPDICNGEDDNCDGDIDEEALDGMALISVDTTSGTIFEIDPTTATATAITTFATTGGINSVAVDGADAIGYDFRNERLTELDICAGTESPLPGHGVGANTCGVVFGPQGKLYGLDSTNDRLVEYDPSTGQMTAIGDLGITIASCGLAYDCTNDVLIGADGSSDILFKIDASTGAAYDSVSVGFDFRAVGLEFDPEIQGVLASDRSNLYEVDISTGSSTLIGTLSGTSNIDDLVYAPECP